MPGTTRGRIPEEVFLPPQPSGSPLSSGRALTTMGQELPESTPPRASFLPTVEALLAAAVLMFLSGTGAVVALGPGLDVSEATIELLVRIRSAIKLLFACG